MARERENAPLRAQRGTAYVALEAYAYAVQDFDAAMASLVEKRTALKNEVDRTKILQQNANTRIMELQAASEHNAAKGIASKLSVTH